jgi:hypothetical protein
MALPEVDSSVGHSFGLEFDGVVIKQIIEISGLKIDQDVVEFKQHTDRGKFIGKKLPGRRSWRSENLRRVTPSSSRRS